MNAPEFEKSVYLWLDRVKSHRYQRSHMTRAINIAIDDFIKDRYDNIKRETGYSFEMVERIRQELNTLVKSVTLPAINNTIITPPDFQYELVTYAITASGRYLCDSIGYNEQDRERNAFTKGTNEYPYMIRTATGYEFKTKTPIISAEVHYLKNQQEIIFGDNKQFAGSNLILGQQYYVEGANIVNGAVVHQPDTFFTATNVLFTGAGSVTFFVNTDVPSTSHNEIVKRASAILAGTGENFNKAGLIENNIGKQ